MLKTAHLECLDACSESSIIDSLEATYRSYQKNFLEVRERFVQSTTTDDERREDDDALSIIASRISSASSGLRKVKSKRLAAELKMKKIKAQYELKKGKT